MENMDFENVINNIDKIKMLSRLLNNNNSEKGKSGESKDTSKNVEKAVKLLGAMKDNNSRNLNEIENVPQIVASEETDTFIPTKEMKVINAAIPFLDKEYQKNIFIAVKLLEMKRAEEINPVTIQSKNFHLEDKSIKRGRMLKAVRPYLNLSEQRGIDILIKVLEMKEIMNFNHEGEIK